MALADTPLVTPVMWSDEDDLVIGGDLTAVLGYRTPAAGVVLTPVAPIGLRDRRAGTVSFTTSLGFGRKLERIDRDPRVTLAYHAREHGFALGARFVLVQGIASYVPHPDPSILDEIVRPAATRFMGAPKTGPFWDRWLAAYYADRVLVTVQVERTLSWPDGDVGGTPSVHGRSLPTAAPDTQAPPRNGTEPRVDARRAARRLAASPHVLLGYAGADGFPMIAPAAIVAAGSGGIRLAGALPPGARRAGLLGHRYGAELTGLRVHQHTGWLAGDTYAPHTERTFRAPRNKTLLLLANGYLARRGERAAARRRAAAQRRSEIKPHRSFDPRIVGRLETQAWVAYYRREWMTLLRASVGLTRHTFGLRWGATLRGAWLILRANQFWAPYPDNDPARARRTMERFYRLVKMAYHEPFDPAEAARLEVEWWRVHREHQRHDTGDQQTLVAPLAALYAYVYGVPEATVRLAAQHRAEAMAISDAWVEAGAEADAPAIDAERAALVRSYASLLAAVHR